mgnify:CR=1 FL=1
MQDHRDLRCCICEERERERALVATRFARVRGEASKQVGEQFGEERDERTGKERTRFRVKAKSGDCDEEPLPSSSSSSPSLLVAQASGRSVAASARSSARHRCLFRSPNRSVWSADRLRLSLLALVR